MKVRGENDGQSSTVMTRGDISGNTGQPNRSSFLLCPRRPTLELTDGLPWSRCRRTWAWTPHADKRRRGQRGRHLSGGQVEISDAVLPFELGLVEINV